MDTDKDSAPKLLLSQEFASFEELAELVIAWNLDFRQISKNFSASNVEQIKAGNILYSNLKCGCFSTHAGETPKGMCTISLPDVRCPEFRFADQLIDRPVLIVSSPGQEFELAPRAGHVISNFSLPYDIINEYCENNFGCSAEKTLESEGRVISIGPEMATYLRSLAQNLSTLSRVPSGTWRGYNPLQSFESLILDSFLYPRHQDKAIRQETNATSRTRLIRRALEFIQNNEYEPLNVGGLSKAIGTSERTLRRLFNREFGLSPQKYLFGQRMYGVHRQLWHSGPSETTVADVANRWGFWHMGQFAKDYQNCYGELPSETLQKPSSSQPKSNKRKAHALEIMPCHR